MFVLFEHCTIVDLNTAGELTFHTEPSDEELKRVESDCFWCVSRLLDSIQDHYTFAQPGIQTRVQALSSLISRLDSELHQHLVDQKVEYLQFSFRWMNNLLMRELPLRCVIRLWDTYHVCFEVVHILLYFKLFLDHLVSFSPFFGWGHETFD